jgi:Uma2 family endonuclease
MSTISSMTAEELFHRPDCQKHCELVKGELRRMSPAGGEHGIVALRIGAKLMAYVTAHDLGETMAAETGFYIERDPDTVLAPDAAFISKARMEEIGIPRAFIPGAPDLVVEVVSPGATAAEVDEKARMWLTAGARLVWNIRPLTRSVEVYRPSGAVEVLGADAALSGEDVVPGFECRIEELFPRR